MKNNSLQSGFTLIELLISIILLSSILFLGNYSYSLFGERWRNEVGNFNQQVHQAKSLTLLKLLTEGITPLVIKDEDDKPVIHFNGGISGLVGTSFNGVLSNNTPVHFELVYEATQDGLGELVYYQVPSDQFLLISTSQYVNYKQRHVLISNLKNATFKYKGYSHYNSLTIESDFGVKNAEKQWFESFSGNERQLLPTNIELLLEFPSDSLILTFTLMNTSEIYMGYNIETDES